MRGWGALVGIATAVLLSACGGDDVPSDVDGSVVCTSEASCDDGVFCNGRELCRPGDEGADEYGCVAGSSPCGEGMCNESADTCPIDCVDTDGDGAGAVECGGDDCDDTDPDRYPGNHEVCDAEGHDEDCDPTTFGDRDVDGDGYVSFLCCNGEACGSDCDDTRRATNPGVPEVCDEIDNDCDGTTDEGLTRIVYLDADFDGIGDSARPINGCDGLAGVSAASGDCDDTLASVRPTAPEICDEIDNDCDGAIDEAVNLIPWYVDADGDGWGTVTEEDPPIESCVPPAGRTLRIGDCDDTNPLVSPSSRERCNGLDDDCDGRADFELAPRDTEDDDLDGVPDAACMMEVGDCNDRDPLSSEGGSPEVCDDRDNDCDGRVDEGATPVLWYVDMDGDRYGDPSVPPIESCDIQPGRATRAGDCDDEDPGTYPGAVDSCTGRLRVDDDCDGRVDEGGNALSVYVDLDGDGFGTGDPYRACLLEARTAVRGGDCDDTNALVNPMRLDDCAAITGVDDDCDGRVDETRTPRTYYVDGDGDGHGTGAGMTGCEQPPGTSTSNRDCDDTDRLRNPDVPDDCATRLGVDDDCDGSTDEARALRSFYLDRDGDGFGTGAAMMACEPPAGTVSATGDCDDDDPRRNPASPDDCSRPMAVDDDCDGRVDEGASFASYFRDLDGDGYGSGSSILSCGAPAGYSLQGGDCNESSTSFNPGRPDDCTTRLGEDDDCDGSIDEGVVLRPWYPDADGDGYGVGMPMMACAAPTGHAPFAGDCDDTLATRNPGRADDCTTTPLLDDDCDTMVDEAATLRTFYRDADGDGFGDSTVTQLTCVASTGYVTNATDCDDSRGAVRPGATEICANGLDDDCDSDPDCADSSCIAGCGILSVVSGGAQSAPMHAEIPGAITVQLADGSGTPLTNRTVTMHTTSVSAPAYTALTDAMGRASFTGVRAGLPLGPETITFRSLGVADQTATVTATAPPSGTIFSVFNGIRNDRLTGVGGPAYTTAVNNAGGMAASADGSVYLVTNERVLRVRPDGTTEWIAGRGCCGIVLPTGDQSLDALTETNIATPLIALDDARQTLYLASSCAIYAIDLATRQMTRAVGTRGTCGNTGDGGAALDATIGGVIDLAVNDDGLLYFIQDSTPGFSRALRYVDRSNAVHTIVRASTGTPALSLGVWMASLSTVPGSSDTLIRNDCNTGTGWTECVVRVTVGGGLTHVAGRVGGSYLDEGIPATTATFGGGFGVLALASGEILTHEWDRDRIRRIDTDGNIWTLGGAYDMPGDVGDGGPVGDSRLNVPASLRRWRGSHVVFWDSGNRAIRAVW
ncbi:MAG: hypothetical protein H6722_29545 [Sandaracinus sp.]|nr:hypothetical protein [Sandaracinus sp.]